MLDKGVFVNLASWIILIVVAVWIFAAIKIAFFGGFRKEKKRGGCCDVGDVDKSFKIETACSACKKSSCAGCSGSATSKNSLVPTIREADAPQHPHTR